MLDFEQLDRLVLVCEGILISIIARIIFREVIPDIIKYIKELFNKGDKL